MNVFRFVRLSIFFVAITLCFLATNSNAQKHQLNEMSLERWSKLREVERHQMQIAEKYYREKNYKVAADEYDKYLSLYETSDAASYALLRWSLCQVQLRKQNTAISDGFRSVIDYWPDSDDALAAGYYIGKTYKDIGQVSKAKPVLKDVVENHPKHIAGVYSMVALAEIATTEKDDEAKVKIWRSLTFDAVRNKQTYRYCNEAADKLASHLLHIGELNGAVEALQTTYKNDELYARVASAGRRAISDLSRDSKTQSKAKKLLADVVSYLRDQEPEDTSSADGKEHLKSLLLMIADTFGSAGDDTSILKIFAEIENRLGADDVLRGKIAQYHRNKKDYDKARAQYRKFDDQANGLSNIASTYRDEQDVQSAVATYTKLTSVDSENAVKWKSESALAYRQFRKYEPAIGVYQELLKEDIEGNDRWLWEIACTYRDASKYKEAIGFFRQTNRFPSNYQEMARCHRRLKQFGEAIALYNQVAGGDKKSAPWALVQIGYTQEEAKSKDKAIAAFKKVCKLFPKDRYASVAHAHLQNKYKLSVTLGGAKDE